MKDTPRAIHAYAVGADGKTLAYANPFAVCDKGFFDGFRIDLHGNLWTSSADSVRAYAPDGTLIGRIPIPELVSNLCFGGPRRNRLYITAQTSLYAIYLNTHEVRLDARVVRAIEDRGRVGRSGRPASLSRSKATSGVWRQRYAKSIRPRAPGRAPRARRRREKSVRRRTG